MELCSRNIRLPGAEEYFAQADKGRHVEMYSCCICVKRECTGQVVRHSRSKKNRYVLKGRYGSSEESGDTACVFRHVLRCSRSSQLTVSHFGVNRIFPFLPPPPSNRHRSRAFGDVAWCVSLDHLFLCLLGEVFVGSCLVSGCVLLLSLETLCQAYLCL